MKIISLHQPWATLLVLGKKKIETRSWSTAYRGPLAIHAAKKLLPHFGQICNSEPFNTALKTAGYDELECFEFGKVIGAVTLSQIATTEEIIDPGVEFPGDFCDAFTFTETFFGNYEPGRFGWLCTHPIKFPSPFPLTGRQRIFNWNVEECDSCDGVGLMEGWNHRDGWPCPKCKGIAITPVR